MGFFWALAGLEVKFQAVSELRTPQIYYKTVAVVFKSKSNHFPGLFDGILRVHFEMTTPDLVKYQIVFVTPMFSDSWHIMCNSHRFRTKHPQGDKDHPTLPKSNFGGSGCIVLSLLRPINVEFGESIRWFGERLDWLNGWWVVWIGWLLVWLDWLIVSFSYLGLLGWSAFIINLIDLRSNGRHFLEPCVNSFLFFISMMRNSDSFRASRQFVGKIFFLMS